MIISWILLISICLAILFLGILVIKKDPKSKVNIYFFILALAIIFWMIFVFFENGINNLALASLFLRLDFAIGPIMAGNFVLFSAYFPQNTTQLSKKFQTSLWLFVLVFSSLSFTDWIIRDIAFKDQAIRFEHGDFYLYYAVFLIGSIIFASSLLIQKYLCFKGIKRLQILYTLLGLAISGSFAAIFNLFFANFLPADLGRLVIYAFVIFIYCTAYAIIRYRFMDIRVIIQRGIIYSLLIIIISGVYSLSVLLLNYIVGKASEWSMLISAGFSVYILVLTLPILEALFKKWTDKIFFKAPIDYRQTLQEINQIFSSEIKLNRLVNHTLKFFKLNLKLKSAAFSYYGGKEGKKIILFNGNTAQIQSKHDGKIIFFNYFERWKKIKKFLILDDLEAESQQDETAKWLLEAMINEKIALCFPVFSKSGFLGLFYLGEKKEESPYFTQELAWLEIIGNQFGLALERAMIFENLERLVADRTIQLRVANNKLKEISEAKSEFVSVASHQLKSPLTVVKDIFFLLNSGDLGKISLLQRDYSNRGIKQIDKLIDLVNMLLNISRIETGRMNMEIKKNNLNSIILEKIKDYTLLAKTARLTIKFDPSNQLKEIKFDKKLISEVVGNLIDNAIKYTPQGQILIRTSLNDNKAIFSITDTGLGISPESMSKLFHRFIRGENNKKLFIAGTGLGLYFCLRVIGAHNGRIWAESPGVDKGSTFKFELPLKPN